MDAPWFEDFTVGDDFSAVPAVTITEGYTAIHQAIFGDRSRLSLDHELSRLVTGRKEALVNPSLVCNVAIGQSTIPSQRVMGNLFYRGLFLRQPVFVGDTLTTSTQVVALKQNKSKPGRAASGMVALEIHTRNQRDDTVLHFWRCPMIPCRDADAITGRQDDFSVMPESITDDDLQGAIPDWDLQAFSRSLAGGVSAVQGIEENTRINIEARDTVTLAPELVRLTQNLAMTHTDASRSVYGKRLVYGGHTISMAAAQLSRHLPGLVSILGWYHCDHTAPVFEEDILRTDFTLLERRPANAGVEDLHILKLQVEVFACRPDSDDIKVLDWSLALLAI